MTTKQLAKRVRSIRKKHGITQVGMSKVLGVSQGTVSKIENAEVEPTMRAWLRFAKRFRVDPMEPVRGRFQ